ncbi:unnamed protein product [Effrenium voratum]|nr:unnamed protein product [Effrenium voratum]
MAECPICLGNVEDACVAPCNHSFCRQCIVQVLVRHPPEWAGSCPLCRTHISVYNLRSGGEVLVQPEVLSLWGTVFVQHCKLGLASYHFESPEECYISYAAAPPSWRLDDGSPPPERKPWKEVSYDEETRIFRGVIEWDPAFFQDVRWVYRLEFAEDFAGIVGGEIVSSSIDGQSQTQPYLAPWVFDWERHLSYLRYTPPPETIFGSVYVQGRLYAPMLEGVARPGELLHLLLQCAGGVAAGHRGCSAGEKAVREDLLRRAHPHLPRQRVVARRLRRSSAMGVHHDLRRGSLQHLWGQGAALRATGLPAPAPPLRGPRGTGRGGAVLYPEAPGTRCR